MRRFNYFFQLWMKVHVHTWNRDSRTVPTKSFVYQEHYKLQVENQILYSLTFGTIRTSCTTFTTKKLRLEIKWLNESSNLEMNIKMSKKFHFGRLKIRPYSPIQNFLVILERPRGAGAMLTRFENYNWYRILNKLPRGRNLYQIICFTFYEKQKIKKK